MSGEAPPGWYPDPEGHDSWRWWDGTNWAAPQPPVPEPLPAVQGTATGSSDFVKRELERFRESKRRRKWMMARGAAIVGVLLADLVACNVMGSDVIRSFSTRNRVELDRASHPPDECQFEAGAEAGDVPGGAAPTPGGGMDEWPVVPFAPPAEGVAIVDEALAVSMVVDPEWSSETSLGEVAYLVTGRLETPVGRLAFGRHDLAGSMDAEDLLAIWIGDPFGYAPTALWAEGNILESPDGRRVGRVDFLSRTRSPESEVVRVWLVPESTDGCTAVAVAVLRTTEVFFGVSVASADPFGESVRST